MWYVNEHGCFILKKLFLLSSCGQVTQFQDTVLLYPGSGVDKKPRLLPRLQLPRLFGVENTNGSTQLL